MTSIASHREWPKSPQQNELENTQAMLAEKDSVYPEHSRSPIARAIALGALAFVGGFLATAARAEFSQSSLGPAISAEPISADSGGAPISLIMPREFLDDATLILLTDSELASQH